MSFPLSDALTRWRLLLGEAASGALGELQGDALAADTALEWLYSRDPGRSARGERGTGGNGPSQLTTPDWINLVHQLFPRETIERLERDAVEQYGLVDLVSHQEVLQRVEPSPALLRAVLRTKHLMNPAVLRAARQLVAQVVRRIMEELATDVRQAFSGTRDRRRRSSLRIARNFSFQLSVRDNLGRWDPLRRKLFIQNPIFTSRVRRQAQRWDLILLVDQSTSMVGSVIHAAVMAACLWQLPGMRTRLVAFDTEVVDLTADVSDPIELLMKVQLGGGTDIARAVGYAQHHVANPRQSIVVLVSDFFEGGSASLLLQRVRALVQSGVTVLGLPALDAQAVPVYDRELAQRLANAGAHIGAMTPGELALWLAQKVQG